MTLTKTHKNHEDDELGVHGIGVQVAEIDFGEQVDVLLVFVVVVVVGGYCVVPTKNQDCLSYFRVWYALQWINLCCTKQLRCIAPPSAAYNEKSSFL